MAYMASSHGPPTLRDFLGVETLQENCSPNPSDRALTEIKIRHEPELCSTHDKFIEETGILDTLLSVGFLTSISMQSERCLHWRKFNF